MCEQEHDAEPKRSEPGQTQRVANMAYNVNIAHQTIYQDGQPRWIQELPLSALELAGQRLYRASRVHEDRANITLMLPVFAAMSVFVLIAWYAKAMHMQLPTSDKILLLLFSGMLGIPVWLSCYDVRRRHRRIVEAAESRLAEIEVEIALRTGKAWRSPLLQLQRWFARKSEHPDTLL
jgi:hypothetical protein